MFFPFGNHTPAYIWYADAPPLLGGIPRLISSAEFMAIYQSKGGKPFQYCETIAYDEPPPADLYTSDYSDVAAVKELLENPSPHPQMDKIGICYVNEIVGFAAFARIPIPAYSLVTVYTGKLVFSKLGSDSYTFHIKEKIRRPYGIDAEQIGGIARFLNHLPHERLVYDWHNDTPEKRRALVQCISVNAVQTAILMRFPASVFAYAVDTICLKQSATQDVNLNDVRKLLQDFCRDALTTTLWEQRRADIELYINNITPVWKEKVVPPKLDTWHSGSIDCQIDYAKQNLADSKVVINNIPVPFFYAARDIQAGEILGYDYGVRQWAKIGYMPAIFYKTGQIIPRDKYSYNRMILNRKHYSGAEAGIFCLRKDYYANLAEQKPMQISPLLKPESFFDIRDVFVANNVIPVTHAQLDVKSHIFAQTLYSLLNNKTGNIKLRVYFHNPDAPSVEEQYVVCVVCHLSDYTAWVNMRAYTQGSVIKDHVKGLLYTQEIIFNNVNVVTDLMRKFIKSFTKKLEEEPDFFTKNPQQYPYPASAPYMVS